MLGLFATKVDRKFDRITLCGSGKWIFESYKQAYNYITYQFVAYVKLLCVRSSTFAGWYFLCPHNLYGVCSSPVTSSHISIYINTIIRDDNVITSSQHAVTAPAMLISRYSLYMLWVPLLESYLNQIPTFLIFNGDLSYTWIRGWSMVTSLRL